MDPKNELTQYSSDGPHALALPGFNLPDENQDARIYGAVLSTGFLALIVVSMRCYVRFKILRTPWWDDYLIIVAMLLAFGGMGIQVAQCMKGFGHHLYYIYTNHGQSGLKALLELSLAMQFIWIFAIMFVKLSVGMFMLRWTRMTKWHAYKMFIYGVMFFIFTYTFIVTVCNAITDFAFALLPIALVVKLQMSHKHKVILIAVLFPGLLAAICSAIRMKFIEGYTPSDEQSRRQPSEMPDGSYTSTELVIWVTVECHIAIIAASLPTLRPLFKTFAATPLKSVRNSRIRRNSAYTTRIELQKNPRHRSMRPNRSYRSIGRSMDRSEARSMTRSANRSGYIFRGGWSGRYEANVTFRDRKLKDEKLPLCELTYDDAAYYYPRHSDGSVDTKNIAVHTEVICVVEDRDEWEDLERARTFGGSCPGNRC